MEKNREDNVHDIHAELRYQRSDGTVIWAEVNSTETYYKGAIALIGTFQDITERKNADAIIKAQAETFEAIIENTNESILLISPDLKVLQFNKTAGDRLYNNVYKRLSIGADFKEFLYPGWEDEFYQRFNDAITGHYSEKEASLQLDSKETLWLRSRMFPIYDSSGKLLGITLLAETITERKKAEKMILQFSRLYQFTSAINEMMLRAETKQQIFLEACQIAITEGKFTMAWVGNYSGETKTVVPYSSAGHNAGYIENLKISVGEDHFTRGVTGNAIRDRKPYYCNDIANDPLMLPV